MKILFITTIPSPYRVAFFNELGKNTELTVLFEKKRSEFRDASWDNHSFENFTGILLNGIRTSKGTAFCPEVVKYLNKKWDFIICCDAVMPTGIWAINYMKLRKIPYWVEGDGAFAKDGKGFKERLKRHIISGAAGYFSTSEELDKYYLSYGAKKEKIHRYPFSSVKDENVLDKPVSCEEKQLLRNKLGIKEGTVILTVGQVCHRKGIDILIQSLDNLPNNVGCYVIGGTASEGNLERFQKEIEAHSVHFIKFLQPKELADYYKAADVFVLPTREDIWGLVINEAMAYGLPVVTTNRCVAGLEMVKSGENGYIIPIENPHELAETTLKCLSCNKMTFAALKVAREYTIEKMAAAHFRILSSLK